MQENTSKLDNFYRNNYYTFDEKQKVLEHKDN